MDNPTRHKHHMGSLQKLSVPYRSIKTLQFQRRRRKQYQVTLLMKQYQVLATKPKGTIRIGLDINGGTSTFAARMIEQNITIITTTLDIDGPLSSFIASRGLNPLHISITRRLPFFDNTLDIVHPGVNGIGTWMPESMLEFAVFRVLRPGGLFWVDHFLCFRSEMKKTYLLFLGKVGFKKVRWHAGENLGNGGRRKRNNEWYISALLEKPKF